MSTKLGDEVWAKLRRRIVISIRTRYPYVGDPEGVAQEALARLIEKYPDVTGESDLLRLLHVITGYVLKEVQREKRHDQLPEDGADPQDEKPRHDESLEQRQRYAQLERAISKLEPRCQTLFRLQLEDKTREEIAKFLGTNPNNVGVIGYRCLKHLREIMGASAGVRKK